MNTNLAAECNTPSNKEQDKYRDVRIVAIFVILVSSGIGAYLPIVTGKVKRFSIPPLVFDAMKFFGSGVVISTAFIHLLAPGLAKLSSPCLGHIWDTWPFGLTFTMIAMLLMFLGDVVAMRLGQAKAGISPYGNSVEVYNQTTTTSNDSRNNSNNNEYDERRGKEQRYIDPNCVASGSYASSTDDVANASSPDSSIESQIKPQHSTSQVEKEGKATGKTQIIGVMVLEFGVILHSFIVGLTLGTSGNAQFVALFIVFVFHQFFEGLGMGARLYDLPVPSRSLLPWMGALVFTLTTPVGIAVGIGIHHTFNGKGVKEALSIGVLDTVASGILLYSSFIELLAHDFIFNPKLAKTPMTRILYNIGWLYLGVAIMTLTRYFAHLSH